MAEETKQPVTPCIKDVVLTKKLCCFNEKKNVVLTRKDLVIMRKVVVLT